MRRGEIRDRVDASYFSLTDSLTRSKFPVHALGDHFWVRDGDHAKFPDSEIAGPDGVRYLRSQDLKDGAIIDDAPIYVSRRYFEKLGRSHIKPGYLLFSIIASIGNCAVVPDEYPDATANRAVGILVPKSEDRLITAYIAFLFETEFGAGLYARIKKGGLQQRTNLADVERLQFPLPPLAERCELVDAMEAARKARRAMLAEADALLAGMDAYLLETLGLASQPNSNHRVFAVRQDALARLDADFHSPRFRAIRDSIERCSHRVQALSVVCERIVTGFAAGTQDQAFDDENGVPHLRPLNLNIYGEISLVPTKRVPRSAVTAEDRCERGEVLFNNTNSTEMVGKSAVFDFEVECACSNHITRLKPSGGVVPEFLAALFNALRSIGYFGLLSTNFNNQAGINLETLSALRVPIPDAPVQQSIAAEIRRRRERARTLRAEAEQGWSEAKRWFEGQLLGPVN